MQKINRNFKTKSCLIVYNIFKYKKIVGRKYYDYIF